MGACAVFYGDEDEDQEQGPAFCFAQPKRARYFVEREISATNGEF